MTEAKSPEETSALIEVRATVHLVGLRAGETALIDPSNAYIKALLDTRRLVPLESE